MSNTRPFTEAHAVATVDVGLIFKDKLSSSARDTLASELKSHLKGKARLVPRKAPDKTIAFRRKIDGDISEEIHVHDRYAHVIFFEYRGWSFTRNEMVERLSPILKLARDGRLALKSTGLVFRDVFVSDNPSKYSALEVFAAGSRWLPAFALSAGNHWRNSFSWIDETQPDLRVRSTLTVEASVESGDDPEDDFHTTEIMHQQEIVGNDSADPMVEWSDARVKSKLDCAHKFNKSMLLDLLAVEMSKRIGLKETS